LKFQQFANKLAASSADAVKFGLTDDKMDEFLTQILQYLQTKERSDHLHEPV